MNCRIVFGMRNKLLEALNLLVEHNLKIFGQMLLGENL